MGSSKGEVTAFSEFNYQRYLQVKSFSDEAYKEAEKDIQAQLDKAKNVSGVVNQYLEYDDDGNLQLCAEVYCVFQPSKEQCYIVLEIRKFTARIK